MKFFLKIVDAFSEALKAKGLKKDGLNYRLKDFGNTALINIQKSVTNSADLTKFTLNVGIHYQSLFLFSGGKAITKPVINDCQWKQRIGHMLPVKRDYWWTIDGHSNLETVSNELVEIFSSIIYPVLTKNLSDEFFMNQLLSNDLTGTTTVGRLSNLTAFCGIYNDNRLPDVLKELKNYCDKNKIDDLYLLQVDRLKNWKKTHQIDYM